MDFSCVEPPSRELIYRMMTDTTQINNYEKLSNDDNYYINNNYQNCFHSSSSSSSRSSSTYTKSNSRTSVGFTHSVNF